MNSRIYVSNSFVSRAQCGKLKVSKKTQELIYRRASYFIGVAVMKFSDCSLREEDVENADQTNFLINVDDGRTMGLRGDDEVRYANVVFGGEGMKMMVRISGGNRTLFEIPFMILKNNHSNYPIQGVPDVIPGVCYRNGPKEWIDRRVMVEWHGNVVLLALLHLEAIV